MSIINEGDTVSPALDPSQRGVVRLIEGDQACVKWSDGLEVWTLDSLHREPDPFADDA